MKILFIGMPDSIHAERWINQLSDTGWDIHFFPVNPAKPRDGFKNVVLDIPENNHRLSAAERVNLLQKLIEEIKPDIIHSMELQHAGYMTMEVKKKLKNFPKWVVTNWGSDIYLFGRIAEHTLKIREVLENCDYYSCESERDVRLAGEYGFKGRVISTCPNSGGLDFNIINRLRNRNKPSSRKKIMLKGYQGWAGRAQVGLRALERAKDILEDYEIIMFSANTKEIRVSGELFANATGIKLTMLPHGTPHEEILKFHGMARISIGVSISDAISTSLLEAMAMGSFPIQSWTSTADEWIEDGKTGILIPPEDPDVIEQAIRIALKDDKLVDNAMDVNFKEVFKRADSEKLKTEIVNIYVSINGDWK